MLIEIILNRLTPGLALLILVAALLSSGCATNPVTGESDFVLMSEDQEIAMGREMHPKVLKAYREYDNQALQTYVQKVGDRLANASHRGNLVYRFTVLDSQEVNAFALPGGYIYITRGLMAYLDSEAELAAVLGHEIGHVTARHAVRQHSATTATGVAAAVTGILAGQAGVAGAGDVANMAGTALVRGYGRGHELEADRLGAEYLARTGYDPKTMLDVIRVLKDQESFELKLAKKEGREPRVYHGLFSTHPDNDTRLKEAVGSANAFKGSGQPRENREKYLFLLNGLSFGDSAEQGIRRGRDFYHQGLGIALSFPAGWRVENQPERLLAIAPGGDGLLQLELQDINRRMSPREFMTERMGLDNLRHGEEIRASGIRGYTALSTAGTPWGKRTTRFVVLYHNKQAYVLAGASRDTRKAYRYDEQILETARSFHALTADERRLAEPLRLRIIKAKPGTSYAGLARQSRIPNEAESQLRLLNQQYPRGEPSAGTLLKLVE